ncbi:MAG: alkaline phosphatase D family protein, partial [Gammaproteobacteria bacterium]
SARSESGVADPAVDDGVVRHVVPGLAPGRTYEYEIVQAGARVGAGLCDTLPVAGTPFAIAYLSCLFHNQDTAEWVADALAAHPVPVKLVVFQGDTPYIDVPTTEQAMWGETSRGLLHWIRARIDSEAGGVVANYDYTDPTERALIKAQAYNVHRAFRRTPGVKRIIERYATIWQADDHERPGDNVTRDDYAQMNSTGSPPVVIVANNDQNNEVFDICREAFQAYYIGNPSNGDANNDSNYDDDDQTYFRLRCNDDLEMLFVDTTEYKTKAADAADVRKIVGDTQRAWLTAQVAASTATSKLISSPAALSGVWRTAAEETAAHPQTADGSDAGERDVIMQALEGFNVLAWIAGDLHHTHVSMHNGIPCIECCPVRATFSQAAGGWDADGRLYLRGGTGNVGSDRNGIFGIVDIHPDGMQHWQVERWGMFKRRAGRQYAGSNALVYEPVKVA